MKLDLIVKCFGGTFDCIASNQLYATGTLFLASKLTSTSKIPNVQIFVHVQNLKW